MKSKLKDILDLFFSDLDGKNQDFIEIPLHGLAFDECIDVVKPYLHAIAQNGTKELQITYKSLPEPTVCLLLNEKKRYDRIYTSGCFDIFHYGHLNILERSKELCNTLIVGVSTDELIEKEKGRRPLIPFDERSRIVSAIKFVDMVIPQVDKNKQRVVDEYKIDAISVGDDWKGKYPPVTCDMVYFEYTPNVSSTIIKKALNF